MSRGFARAVAPTLAFWACSCTFLVAGEAEDLRRRDFFETKIRPVLVEHCYECHSADSKVPQGDLRVDHAAALLTGGATGPSLVPGKPDESLLISALRYEDYEMPPDGRLPEAVIRDFEKWVRDGAFDPREETADSPASDRKGLQSASEYWAFSTPTLHQPPAVQNVDWPQQTVDRFVLARMEAAGLHPSAEADRRTLIRRLSFDLTGLPPTTDEIDAFVSDSRPDAYWRLVERLLASPRFGETWGRHWLDLARYADSNGGDFNATYFHAWRYRDYVISTFNNDKPFDRFVLEQIAGDLLPATDEREVAENIIATGFLAIGPKMISERDKEKLRMDIVDEQLDTIGKAFLGMTVGCARCHDHKFDPIPTSDYYALAGILRSTATIDGEIQKYVSDHINRPLPIPTDVAEAIAAHKQQVKAAEGVVASAKTAVEDLEAKVHSIKGDTIVVDDDQATLVGTWKETTYSSPYVGRGYRHDDNNGKGEKSITFPAEIPQAGSYQIQIAYTPGGGRAGEIPVTVVTGEDKIEARFTFSQNESPTIEKLYGPLGPPVSLAAGPVAVTLSNKGTTGHVIADAVRFVLTSTPEMTDAEREALAKVEEDLKQAKSALQAEENVLADLKKNAPQPPMALAVREATDVGDCFVRIRGESSRLGEKAPRGFLSVCGGEAPSFSPNESGRRELAEWLTRPDHPLTARVFVNRVWMHLFGQGIVRSVDNFGQTGETPSHPELLDDLAVRFVDSGWSIKALVRELVLSQTYRQSTTPADSSIALDPENRLLSHMNRRRLTAESLRDAMLILAGRFENGPNVAPMAGFGTLAVDSSGKKFGEVDVSGAARRSVYLPIVRNEVPAVLTVFDFADPEAVMGERPVTNVPAQALFLLNSAFVREAARSAAGEFKAISADEAAGVDELFRQALARPATEEELSWGTGFLRAVPQGDEPWTLLVQAVFASTAFRTLE